MFLEARTGSDEVTLMKDVVFVTITLVFFLLSWLYVRACDRL